MNEHEVLVLNSDSTRHFPISLVKSDYKRKNQTTLQLLDVSTSLSTYFIAFGFIESDTVYSHFDQQGEAILDGVGFDSLQVMFEFCPDHMLLISAAKKYNYFEVKCDQTIFEIFFKNFSLLISNNKLEGKHPVLGGEYQYLKQN